MIEPDALLPRGVIVGSAIVEKCEQVASDQLPVASEDRGHPLATNNSQLATLFEWHLAVVRRIKTPRKPKGHPQPAWFKPF
jgi:hypothetical protein